MSFQDKTIHCTDGGADFTFTADEQQLFQTRGYTNEPKRCPTCREARKAAQNADGGGTYRSPRQMFSATCAQCGKETQVPFKPTNGRPVYCSDCYTKVRPGR